MFNVQKHSDCEGLSKREKMKFERLMKAETVKKQKESKKQKLSKNVLQKVSQKLKTEQISHQKSIIENQFSNQQQRINQTISEQQNKKYKRVNHLNSKFPLQQNQSLFDYLSLYSFLSKAKKIQDEKGDNSFLDKIQGFKLKQKQQIDFLITEREVNKKFLQYKKQKGLFEPFDQNHLEFMKNIFNLKPQ